jgi:hypothetical protein
MKLIFLVTLILSSAAAMARPASYTELLDYVTEAPDQGDTNTCLFIASTGAIELIANKAAGIKNPAPFGPYDLAESFTINSPTTISKSFIETPVLKYNRGQAVHISHWPFEAWNGTYVNKSVWSQHPNFSKLPRITVPKVETIKLFQFGNRWSTNVLNDTHVEMIKEALWKHKSPVIVNYNDEYYWHVILIVGYDDNLPGECYDTDPKECEGDIGSFYIRDSFGVKVELRDYDWFRVKGNAAAVVKAAE